MRTDLHIHTTASDGRWSPERVVAEVQARDIGLFATADHDSVASVGQAEALAREAGLTFLRGVEVSTRRSHCHHPEGRRCAHPGPPGVSLRHTAVTDERLRPFLDFGIAGLECYTYYHDEATTRFCLDWCTRHDLLITGGSDCHGGFVGRELGVPAVDTADLRLGELEERIIGRGREWQATNCKD